MTAKEVMTENKDELYALLDYANSVTEKSDTNIGNAIKTLCDGYGQGGGSSVKSGTITPSADVSELTIDGLGFVPKLAILTIKSKDDVAGKACTVIQIAQNVITSSFAPKAIGQRINASGGTTLVIVSTVFNENSVVFKAISAQYPIPSVEHEYFIIG